MFGNKKTALSFTEALITLGILGTLISIAMPVIRTLHPDTKLLRVKNINSALKQNVDTLLHESSSYSEDNDFSTTGTIFNDDGTSHPDWEKFRNAFASLLSFNEQFQCSIFLTKGVVANGNCYFAVDGNVWGLPDTDFEDYNTVSITKNNFVLKYVPITVYAEYDEKLARTNPKENLFLNAVVYGLRRDGDLIILEDFVDCDQYPKAVNCNAKDYITTSKTRRGR